MLILALKALTSAGFAQADTKETIAMIKANLMQSKEKIKQYSWIETTKVYLNGELKTPKQN